MHFSYFHIGALRHIRQALTDDMAKTVAASLFTYVSTVITKIRQRSIKYQGPFVWNKLSTEIKNSPSVPTFKTKLNQYLLDSY